MFSEILYGLSYSWVSRSLCTRLLLTNGMAHRLVYYCSWTSWTVCSRLGGYLDWLLWILVRLLPFLVCAYSWSAFRKHQSFYVRQLAWVPSLIDLWMWKPEILSRTRYWPSYGWYNRRLLSDVLLVASLCAHWQQVGIWCHPCHGCLRIGYVVPVSLTVIGQALIFII